MKKNKYIMISLSVILVALITLIPIRKINAEELESRIYNYDNSTGVLANYEKFAPALEEARVYLEQYKNDYYYFILFSNSQINVILRQKSDYVNFYLTLDSNYVTLYLNHTNGAYLKELGFYAVNVDDFNTKFASFKTKLESGNLSTIQYGASYSSSYLTTGGISSAFQRVYYTNYDNYILSEDSVYSLNLNDSSIINPGDEIPTYYEHINGNKFDKIYSSAEYSKIEIEFELNSEIEIALFVNAVNEESYFSIPYLEADYSYRSFTSAYNYKEITYVSDISNYNYYYNVCTYYDLDNLENDKYYTAVRLVIPLDSSVVQDIRVQLVTTVDYEVTEFTKEEFDYNLTSLDLTNKKGAIFVTKDINTTYNANFEVDGYFYIEIRDSLDDTYYDVEKRYTYGFCDLLLENQVDYKCSESNKFSYAFGIDNLNRIIHFRNLYSTDNVKSIVYYDSSKFDVYIIENNSTNITIKDPHSGNDIDFNVSIYEDVSRAEIDIDYLVNLIEEFLHNNDNSVELVKEILLLFFDEMPEEIYQAFVVVMFVIFVGSVIIIVGWK